MKRLRLIAIVLLVGLFLAAFRAYPHPPSSFAAPAQKETNEVRVWVNTSSGVYHCPGTRGYGNMKHGNYVGECAAILAGNRPAYGKACGSDCLTPHSSSPPTNENSAPSKTEPAGNPDAKVWVNTNSGMYHCWGTRWYGNTKQGEFMSQKKAQEAGNRPAYGKVCW